MLFSVADNSRHTSVRPYKHDTRLIVFGFNLKFSRNSKFSLLKIQSTIFFFQTFPVLDSSKFSEIVSKFYKQILLYFQEHSKAFLIFFGSQQCASFSSSSLLFNVDLSIWKRLKRVKDSNFIILIKTKKKNKNIFTLSIRLVRVLICC